MEYLLVRNRKNLVRTGTHKLYRLSWIPSVGSTCSTHNVSADVSRKTQKISCFAWSFAHVGHLDGEEVSWDSSLPSISTISNSALLCSNGLVRLSRLLFCSLFCYFLSILELLHSSISKFNTHHIENITHSKCSLQSIKISCCSIWPLSWPVTSFHMMSLRLLLVYLIKHHWHRFTQKNDDQYHIPWK